MKVSVFSIDRPLNFISDTPERDVWTFRYAEKQQFETQNVASEGAGGK